MLGRGGMGEVFLGRHRRTGRVCAIKVLLGDAPDLVERFRREAETVASLAHVGIVSVLDFDEDERGAPFLVMEHLEGEPLDEVLSRGPMEPDVAIGIMAELCDAVSYAHERGVLHRDLKPSNVFMARREGAGTRPVLLDFGIAKLRADLTRLTATGMALGTPAYMAPEQARALPLDERADVYALGALFFEMITGTVPFPAPTPTAMMARALTDPAPAPSSVRPEVSPHVDALVLSALAKDPDARPPSAREFAARLTRTSQAPSDVVEIALAETRAAPAIDSVIRAPQKRNSTGRAWLLAGLGVLMGIAALGLAALIFFGRAGPDIAEKPEPVLESGETRALERADPVPSETAMREANPVPETDDAETHDAESAALVLEPPSAASPDSPRTGAPTPMRRTRRGGMSSRMTSSGSPPPSAMTPAATPPAATPSAATPMLTAMQQEEFVASVSLGELFSNGDHAGCLREARRMPRARRTPRILMWEMQCARGANNESRARSACGELARRFPQNGQNRACEALGYSP